MPRIIASVSPLLLLAGAIAAAAPAHADPSTSLTVTGTIANPTTYTASGLAALPQVTESVTYTAAGTPVSATFSGPTLASVVAAAQVTTGSTARNATLPYYLTATGSDGYQVVYSLGEIDPNFGGAGTRPPLAATSVNGGSLGSNGFARTTAPNDAAGGRYVSDLTNLDIEHAAPVGPLPSGGGVSSSFTLSGQVATPGTYTQSSLQAMPPVTETTTYQSASGSVTATYTGVSLWGLLSQAGILSNPAVKNSILDEYVDVIGTDGYQAVISLGEIDPAFGNAPDLVAYSANGGGLGSNGLAELVVPGDVYGGRYVHNIAEIQVLNAATAVPEPAGLAIVLAPLAGLGLLAAARRRRV